MSISLGCQVLLYIYRRLIFPAVKIVFRDGKKDGTHVLFCYLLECMCSLVMFSPKEYQMVTYEH